MLIYQHICDIIEEELRKYHHTINIKKKRKNMIKVRTTNNWLHFGVTHLMKNGEYTATDEGSPFFGQFKNAKEFKNKTEAKAFIRKNKIKMFDPQFEKC